MKDNGFGSIGTGSKFQKIGIGQSHTFHVVGKITEEERVWEGNRPRLARETDDPKDIKKTFNFTMVGADGIETTFPATYGFVKSFRAAVEAVDGTLNSHRWKVVRGGELTKPVYVFECMGAVDGQAVAAAPKGAAVAADADAIAARKAAIAAKKAASEAPKQKAPEEMSEEEFVAAFGAE